MKTYEIILFDGLITEKDIETFQAKNNNLFWQKAQNTKICAFFAFQCLNCMKNARKMHECLYFFYKDWECSQSLCKKVQSFVHFSFFSGPETKKHGKCTNVYIFTVRKDCLKCQLVQMVLIIF